MVVKSFTEFIYGKERRARDGRDNIITERLWDCACICPSAWVTFLLTQLHCQATSDAEELRGPGAAPRSPRSPSTNGAEAE